LGNYRDHFILHAVCIRKAIQKFLGELIRSSFMKDTWVIVANSTVARIFKVQKQQDLVEIETLVHTASRLHARDLVSDQSGRTFDSVGTGRHAIEPTTDPKAVECITFAKEIAHYLHDAHAQGRFDRLYVAAGPSTLGLLRQNFSPAVTKLVQEELNKDIAHLKPAEIINHLPFLLYR
jgi:protein required for attachment to host cells